MIDLDQPSLLQFKKVLRSLENTSSNIPEIRQLREQQEYLEKLRDQRTKIEELKGKFDQKDSIIKKLQTENAMLRKQLEQSEKKFQKFELRIHEQQENSKKVETAIHIVETERDRYKSKVLELQMEREQYRKQNKSRESSILMIEDQYKRKYKETREAYAAEKRKLIESYQQKISHIQVLKSKADDAEKMQQLIDRQNRALKLQEESLTELSQRNQELEHQLEEVRQIYQKAILCRDELSGEADYYKQEAQRLSRKLKQLEEEQAARQEVEVIKSRMNQLRRGQIQRIQQIFSDLS